MLARHYLRLGPIALLSWTACSSDAGRGTMLADASPPPAIDAPVAPPDDPPVDDGTITSDPVASRTSGVAPLAVLFDATATTGAARPFHDLHYGWTFGDDDAATWAVSGRSRNRAAGAVAAHLFETPGHHVVTVAVRNAQGQGVVRELAVDVADPDVVFAAATYCFSTGTDFAGCPAGATHVTTTDPTAIAGYAGPMRRLLLRRGDTWTTTQAITIEAAGPAVLGAFGACTSPDARGLCANAPRLTTTSAGITLLSIAGDWRVMDLELAGVTGTSNSTGIGVGGIGTLLLRVRTRGFQQGVVAAFYRVDSDQIAIVDSDLGQANGNDAYVGAERLMLLGNHMHDAFTSHVLRVPHAYKAVIAENLIENASVGGENGRHALKLHGFAEGDGGDEDGLTEGTNAYGQPLQRTRFVVVTGNTFGASPPWPVSVGPQYDGSDERVSDVVFERNFFRTRGTSFPGAQPLDTPIHCTALGDITVRNNIFDATGAGEDFAALDISRDAVSPPTVDRVTFDNNLVYRADQVGTRIVMVRVGAAAHDTHVRNNLGIAPAYAAAGQVTVEDAGVGTNALANAYLEASVIRSAQPQFPADFQPSPGAASADRGVAAPVIDDLDGHLRTGAMDLGPFDHAGH